MALQSAMDRRHFNQFGNKTSSENNHNRHDSRHHNYDDESHNTDDLLENYRYLTQYCRAFRQTPAINIIDSCETTTPLAPVTILRQYSTMDSHSSHNNHTDYDCSLPMSKQWRPSVNDVNNNTTNSRVPPTIYYDDPENDDSCRSHSFSLIKLFARVKSRLKHDKRYHTHAPHELLSEDDLHDWNELTKNVRPILTKVLVPPGEHDTPGSRPKRAHSKQGSCKKDRDHRPVLTHDDADEDEDKVNVEIDDEQHTEENEEFDEIVWNKFQRCARGNNYRRLGVCKVVDRQQFQGQLVYFYSVANNILIDENLKASGLG